MQIESEHNPNRVYFKCQTAVYYSNGEMKYLVVKNFE